jgi:hypothetical protein
MSTTENLLERLPIATIVHLLVAIVLGLDLIIHGNLSDDALSYAAIVEGGNGLVGLGRAHVTAAKVASAPQPLVSEVPPREAA